jgi:hypothetical protein
MDMVTDTDTDTDTVTDTDADEDADADTDTDTDIKLAHFCLESIRRYSPVAPFGGAALYHSAIPNGAMNS